MSSTGMSSTGIAFRLIQIALFAGVSSSTLCGCAGQSFRSVASEVLGSTGLVSSSQADAFFQAGEHVISAATPLNDEQEYFLGRGVSATILERYRPYRNAALQRYVNLVGNVMAGVSDRPDTFRGYHFLVLDSVELNAMAAPSGFIFVSRGLLKQLNSEDELAAVLAHEVAHVVYNHGVNAVSQSKLTKAVSIVGAEAANEYPGGALNEVTDLFSESVSQVTETLMTSGYSRSQEYSADEYAVELLGRAGYDRKALRRVLEKLEQLRASSSQSGGWFETHPDPDDRIDELEDAQTQASVSKGLSVRTARFNGAIRGVH